MAILKSRCSIRSFSRGCGGALLGAILFAAMSLPAAVSAIAQESTAEPRRKRDEPVKPEVHLSVDRLPAGRTCQILIRLTVQPGWHVNANPASADTKPTEVALKSTAGTRLTAIKYPKGKLSRPSYADEPVSVYEGRVDIFGVLAVPESAGGKTDDIEIAITYQACNDTECLLPKTQKLVAKLPVAAPGEAVKAINQKLFSAQPPPQ
jgi:DsbC/DsbD-like thiol-disulfide interchange protein